MKAILLNIIFLVAINTVALKQRSPAIVSSEVYSNSDDEY